MSRKADLTFTGIIVVILIAIAMPIYRKSVGESVLKSNLLTLRTAMDNYAYDKEKSPQSLLDLVFDGYLKSLPELPPGAPCGLGAPINDPPMTPPPDTAPPAVHIGIGGGFAVSLLLDNAPDVAVARVQAVALTRNADNGSGCNRQPVVYRQC